MPIFLSDRSSLLSQLSSTSLVDTQNATSFQRSLDEAMSGFSSQLTDLRSIAPMMAGSLTYGLFRSGSLALMGSSLPTRMFSSVIGLAGEVTVFEGVGRSFRGEVPIHRDPTRSDALVEPSFMKAWFHSFVNFGLLKLGGHAGANQNIFIQHLMQDSAMVAGNYATAALRLSSHPQGSLFEQALHAEMTNIQLGFSMSVAHRLTPGLSGYERMLPQIHRGHTSDSVGAQLIAPVHSESTPVESTSESTRERGSRFENIRNALRDALLSPMWMMMGAGGLGGGRGPKRSLSRASAREIRSVPELPASMQHWTEEARQKGFKENEVLEFISEQLLKKYQEHRNAFLPEERDFLITLGHHWQNLYEQGQVRDLFFAFKIFLTLYDLPGLRRTARFVKDEHMDKKEVLMLTEEYEEAFRIFDSTRPSFHQGVDEWLFHSMKERAVDFIKAFARRRGYQESDLSFYSSAHSIDLATLASSYDLVVAIARGGLFSGALAEMLGMDVRVIEIHAHDRETPVTRWIDPIQPEEIAGKRILFVDKDAVSGATLREAKRLFSLHHPAALGAYFNLDGKSYIPAQNISDLRNLGVTIHTHEGIRPIPSLPVFNRIHEALKTPRGILRQVDRALEELLPPLQSAYPEVAENLRRFADEQRKLFLNLHPGLSGVDVVRERIASRLQGYLRTYQEIRSLGENEATQHLTDLIKTSPMLPEDFDQRLAMARYHERALDLARQRGVENPHFPASYPASFRSAQQALRKKYDLALIVGPEGFAYEPIFEDLGLPSLAVNIPEDDFNGSRSFQSFGDLSAVMGKRVLVVEDDVQSGATLRALLKALVPHSPSFLGLYLGAPLIRQMTANIPKAFQRVVVTQIDETLDRRAFMKHLQRRETVFVDQRGRGNRY